MTVKLVIVPNFSPAFRLSLRVPVPDYTGMFNTTLDPKQEQAFVEWASKSGKQKDLFNYDLRGAWKDGIAQDARGHLPDTYKKPNHPTFSSESLYSSDSMPGGDWVKNGDKWVYKPSPINLQFYGPGGLQEYFKAVEPDVELILPQMVN